MNTIPETLSQAYRHHQAGNLQQAEQCYRHLLQTNPQHVDALHMLGLLAHQTGRNDIAQEYIGTALRLHPDFTEAHSNLGNVLQQLGKLEEAIASWRRALQLKPHFPEVHCNLGLALLEQGKLEEAMASFRQALRLRPNYSDAHNNLGIVFKEQGEFAQAVVCYQQALQLRPDNAQAHVNLGATLHEQGKPEEAVSCYHQALRFDPNYVEAHCNLGLALKELGRLDQAQASLQRAVQLKPTYAEAHMNLGFVFQGQGRPDQAVVCYQQAVRLKPDFAEAHNHLGFSLAQLGRTTEAELCCQHALQLNPDFSGAHNNLGLICLMQGKLDEALAFFRQSLHLKPDCGTSRGNLLFTMQYCPGITLAELAEAHAEYERRHAASLRGAWKPHVNVRDPEKKLRLGLVSAHFAVHPVGFFLIRAVENIDRSETEVVCYSNRPIPDAMTGRFQATATVWRDVVGLTDAQLAEQICADKIDILFDLDGHTAGNRLFVFARKPAPIQISWVGYEGTTGLTAIDYILADHHVIPVGSERHYVEGVLRMPHGYLCYDPPVAAPPVGPLPALAKGFTTFCSFNNLSKITPQVVAVWAKILRSVPRSRLILQYRGLGDETVRGRYTALFAECGVDAGQLDLRAPTPHADYLATYEQADIALDPFPFAGGTITCEALWMGVPVVTCPGETFASRHGLSHLSNIGITETIARDLDGYVETAVALARDLPRLSALRRPARANGRFAAVRRQTVRHRPRGAAARCLAPVLRQRLNLPRLRQSLGSILKVHEQGCSLNQRFVKTL